jgi:L-lysine exporter family protein LysE/ArgO
VIAVYAAGFLLGLGLITPIGPQNVFVAAQGLAVGLPRALWAVCTAGACDTMLILVGAFGAAAALDRLPTLRLVLLGLGAAYLFFIGAQALRTSGTRLDADGAEQAARPRSVLAKTVSVSLLNPHAVLDTVGVIGAAVAAQPVADRGAFAVGSVSASWLWFVLLAVGGAVFRRHLTPRRARYFDWFSGAVMLVFAALLTVELVRAVG